MHIDFQQDYVLENETVLLRPLKQEDEAELACFVENEPEIWQYSLARLTTRDDLNRYIDYAVQQRRAQKEYVFIVRDKVSGRYAGSTRFYEINARDNALTIGYTWYGKDFQGTHVNKNCKYLLLQLAFEVFGVDRVEFRADLQNERSIRAMLSIGCVKEGILRSHAYKADGSRRDSIILSVLKQEWEESVKGNLQLKIIGGGRL